MIGTKRIAAGVAVVGLATTVAACSSSPKELGSFSTLTGQSTSVALDSTFVQALTSLKVAPSAYGTATLDASTGTVSFPITGGHATIDKPGTANPYVTGEIDHNGSGLNLTAGSTEVSLRNFKIDPGSNSELTGDVFVNDKEAAPGAKLFTLDGSTLKTPTISNGVATLTGTTVYLDPVAVGLLNSTFKLTGTSNALPTKAEAIKVGIATIKATGK